MKANDEKPPPEDSGTIKTELTGYDLLNNLRLNKGTAFAPMQAPRIINWYKKHIVIGTILGLLTLYLAYELLSGIFVYSRDVYVTTDVISVASEVSGPLAILAVKDDQPVQQGDLLIKINPEPFQLEVDRLQANLDLSRAKADKAKEEVAIAVDRVASRQAQFEDAKIDFERAIELRKSGDIAQQALDDAHRAYDVAMASLEAARASRLTAEQEVSVQSAAVAEARAAVARAKYDLDRTGHCSSGIGARCASDRSRRRLFSGGPFRGCDRFRSKLAFSRQSARAPSAGAESGPKSFLLHRF